MGLPQISRRAFHAGVLARGGAGLLVPGIVTGAWEPASGRRAGHRLMRPKLPIFPGLVRYDEVGGLGSVRRHPRILIADPAPAPHLLDDRVWS
jgi:hypothetical protein